MATSEEIAWAAGLFEGEGTVTICGERLSVQLTSTDEDVVKRFEGILQAGRAYGPYENRSADGSTRKPFWRWMASSAEAYAAIELLGAWLGARRRAQCVKVLEHVGAEPPCPCETWPFPRGTVEIIRFDAEAKRARSVLQRHH